MHNKVLFIILTITLSFSVTAQDDSRWSGGVGYFTNMSSHAVSGVENDFSMIKLGLTRHIRVNESKSLFYGLEVSRLSVTIPDYNTGILTPNRRGSEVSPTMVTLILGTKSERFEGLFYLTGALLLEYDFGAPEEFGYALQNGLGMGIGLGKDIHLSEEFVISIEPSGRLRGGVNFRSGDTDSFGGGTNKNLMIDLGGMISLGYKFF